MIAPDIRGWLVVTKEQPTRMATPTETEALLGSPEAGAARRSRDARSGLSIRPAGAGYAPAAAPGTLTFTRDYVVINLSTCDHSTFGSTSFFVLF